jgi:hypothetical protein
VNWWQWVPTSIKRSFLPVVVGAPNRPGVVGVTDGVGATDGVDSTVGVGATVGVEEVGVTDVIGESLLGGIRFFRDSSRLLR